jgi:hypothetical protein
VEVGSGRGLKSLAWSGIFGRSIAIDVDEQLIEDGRGLRRRLGAPPAEFIVANAVDALATGGAVDPGDVGLLVLYAVLEHLTPVERAAVLRLARGCYDRGAAVLIAESPNRLYPFDHHSSQMHFVQMLPDELARRYLRLFNDHPVRRFILEGDREDAQTMLYRSGRALGYHEFQLDFSEGPIDFAPVFDGYHPELIDLEPLTRTELALQTYLESNQIPAPRAFSRSWIDMLLLKDSPRRAARSVELLPPSALSSAATHRNPAFWSLDRFTAGADGSVRFDIPPGSTGVPHLLVDAEQAASGVEVTVDRQPVFSAGARDLAALRPPTWHHQFAIPIPAPTGAAIEVRPARGAEFASVMGVLIDRT